MGIVYEESFGIIPIHKEKGEWKVLLILHKYGNHWGFPKGKPNPNEGPRDSALRELHEETGLKVESFITTDPIAETYSFYRKENKVEKSVTYFLAIVSGALLLQPEEIRDGKWLTFDEALDKITFKEAKALCERVRLMVEKL